jgi:hypothetical protein
MRYTSNFCPPGSNMELIGPNEPLVVEDHDSPLLGDEHVLPVPVLLAEQQVEHRAPHDSPRG